MLRRLRQRLLRVRRVILTLALVSIAAPAVAGPLAYCLNSGDTPRVVAAANHCEMMAKATAEKAAKARFLAHFSVVDEAVGTGSGTVLVPTGVQTAVLFMHVGGLLPPMSGLLPSRSDAYGGAPCERSSKCSLAGAVAGHSARLLI